MAAASQALQGLEKRCRQSISFWHNTKQSESAAAVTFSDHSFGLIPSTGSGISDLSALKQITAAKDSRFSAPGKLSLHFLRASSGQVSSR